MLKASYDNRMQLCQSGSKQHYCVEHWLAHQLTKNAKKIAVSNVWERALQARSGGMWSLLRQRSVSKCCCFYIFVVWKTRYTRWAEKSKNRFFTHFIFSNNEIPFLKNDVIRRKIPSWLNLSLSLSSRNSIPTITTTHRTRLTLMPSPHSSQSRSYMTSERTSETHRSWLCVNIRA